MAKQIEANGHAVLLAQRTSGGESAPELEPLAATLVATLEQALLAAQRLLRALNGTVGHHADATQVLRLLAPLDPCVVVGHPACCCTDDSACANHDPSAAPTATMGLTPREAEVLRLLAAGRSNQQIAQALFLSPRTVQRHVANAYLKIGAHNKADATAYALRHKLA